MLGPLEERRQKDRVLEEAGSLGGRDGLMLHTEKTVGVALKWVIVLGEDGEKEVDRG